MSKRTFKLDASGREVTVGPLKWDAFEPLMGEAFKIFVERVKDLGEASSSPQFLVNALYSILGNPRRWMQVASTRIARWLAWGVMYGDDAPKLGKDGTPDLSDWSAEEVAELLDVASELTDFKVLSERLKNSLGPITNDLVNQALVGPDKTTDENSDESADEDETKTQD